MFAEMTSPTLRNMVAELTTQGHSAVDIAATLEISPRKVRKIRQQLGLATPPPVTPAVVDLDGEHWLPVVGYEDLYEISDMGRVRSLDRVTVDSLGRSRPFPGILLTPNMTGDPAYPSVNLRRDGRSRIYRLHELVLAAFVGPRPSGYHGRHLDDNKLDNRLTNLTWGTVAENAADARRNGRTSLATHCARGHEFTTENTVQAKTQRYCRTCKERRERKAVAS